MGSGASTYQIVDALAPTTGTSLSVTSIEAYGVGVGTPTSRGTSVTRRTQL
jgi:hypothetical protein